MKFLFFGVGDLTKPRLRILLDAIEASGHVVDSCHRNIWQGVADKSQMSGFKKISVAMKWILSYPYLLTKYLFKSDYDHVLIAYPGILDIILLYPLAKIKKKKIIFDLFISIYDTIVLDRQLLRPDSLAAKMIYKIERFAIGIADHIFLDTEAHATRIQHLFDMNKKIGSVWVGVEDIFFSTPKTKSSSPPEFSWSEEKKRILFYGQFTPLHGLENIIDAAQILKNEPIEWLIIGTGQEAPKIDQIIQDQDLQNIRRIEWVKYESLIHFIDTADLCLGIFGNSGKAQSVIPNKVFQVLARKKPVLTMDSPAMHELKSKIRNPHLLTLTNPSPQNISQAILNFIPNSIKETKEEDTFSKDSIASMFISSLQS